MWLFTFLKVSLKIKGLLGSSQVEDPRANAGDRVQPLVREDPLRPGATRPVHHTDELALQSAEQLLKPARPAACAPQREKPPKATPAPCDRGAHSLQPEENLRVHEGLHSQKSKKKPKRAVPQNTSNIPSNQQPCLAGGYCILQHRHRTFPSWQKILLNSTVLKGNMLKEKRQMENDTNHITSFNCGM